MDDPTQPTQQGGGVWKWAAILAAGAKVLDVLCQLWLRRAAALDAAERRMSDRMDEQNARHALAVGELLARIDGLELELAEERRQKEDARRETRDALDRLQLVEAENGKLRERVGELERTVEQLAGAKRA